MPRSAKAEVDIAPVTNEVEVASISVDLVADSAHFGVERVRNAIRPILLREAEPLMALRRAGLPVDEELVVSITKRKK